MTEKKYDVVIVGAGIAGAILAKTLANAGHRVLILEAGLQAGLDLNGNEFYLNYQSYLDRFYLANAKVPNSPYPNLKNAPSPNVLDTAQLTGTTPNTNGLCSKQPPLICQRLRARDRRHHAALAGDDSSHVAQRLQTQYRIRAGRELAYQL